MRIGLILALAYFAASALANAALAGSAPAHPWDDPMLPPDRRAVLAVAAMTPAEKIGLVHGGLGAPWGGAPKPAGAVGSAGFVPGVPRLGIPPLQETDAELGVGDPGDIRPGDTATAMPSNLALGSTFDPALAVEQGRAVGAEARAKGFDVLLGGTANIIRDPRGGRDFEYVSEDPLLTGTLAGAAVAGAQGNRIISTVKHFVLNDQETDRVVLDARIERAAMRESDLFAFELAIERGRPGSVMCAYNQVDGAYACENDWLLNRVLKTDWHYPGYVMSDWGAVHSTVASALAGLDQESGDQLDTQDFFAVPLAEAVARGEVPAARLDDMVRRILRSVFAAGIYDDPPRPGAFDPAPAAAVAQRIAEAGSVLLKNDGVLPLPPTLPRIAVIGAHADRGVLAGGGSSQVVPTGGIASSEPAPDGFPATLTFDPSSPLDAIRRHAPGAEVGYADGHDVTAAARLAAGADVAIVFADKWMTETADAPDLALPGGQDGLIAAVARANPRTVVVLETGGPVLMPWLARVRGVLEAWYPGQRGGAAVASILFAQANPSGHLPVTWPAGEAQLPHPTLQGDPNGAPRGPVGRGGRYGRIYAADYSEGAAVGYKWFATRHQAPLFPFGFGLSYTSFGLRDLSAGMKDGRLTVGLTVRNAGGRAGAAVPQAYVERPGDPGFPIRLGGFERVELAPGEERRVTFGVDPRLLARFDEAGHVWRIAPGRVRVTAGFDAVHRGLAAETDVSAASLAP
ncbi:MAG TPA: glycoside hydrolase family 3 C-terminal domain-containing protein [Lichenihabitans sp.]|jgi:beta-glucosidase|nr:glycoside hydrolase family 3 C-terminal domain-containing protein [Lichenihabitans sp.]